MSRRALFMRLLVKAAWVRKDRAFTALLSIGVVATIATVALTVYSDLESKLSREFTRFGANAVIAARHGSLTPQELADQNHHWPERPCRSRSVCSSTCK